MFRSANDFAVDQLGKGLTRMVLKDLMNDLYSTYYQYVITEYYYELKSWKANLIVRGEGEGGSRQDQ